MAVVDGKQVVWAGSLPECMSAEKSSLAAQFQQSNFLERFYLSSPEGQYLRAECSLFNKEITLELIGK